MKIPTRLKLYARSFKPNEFVYTTLCSRLKVRPNTIMMESSHGRILRGNTEALFNAIIKDDRFSGWQIIISVIPDLYDEVKDEYSLYDNVKVIRFQSIQYAYYLSTTQFLINDNTFFPYFSKKKDQIYFNPWHGTPFKCMGFDESDITSWKLGNTVRNFIHCDYILVTSEYFKGVFDRAYRLPGVFNATMLIGGYPSNDTLVNHTGDNVVVEKLRTTLSLPAGKKVVLYAPTWRGRIGQPLSTEYLDKVTLSKLVKNHDDIVVLYRGHPIVDSTVNFYGRVIDVSSYKEVNDLFLCADVLITDYSSLYVDYSILGKPVLFYMYDEELYQEERGFYQEMYKQLPGPVCKNIDTLSVELEKHLSGDCEESKDKIRAFREKFCQFDDGKVAKDIVDQVFFGKNRLKVEQYRESDQGKKKLLMFMGGWFTNGVTVSAINVLNNLDYTKYSVDLIMRPTAFNYPHNIRQIPDQVNMISYSGNMALELLGQYFIQLLNIPGIAKINRLKAYKKEFKRLLGNKEYDAVINFCGYSPFFTSLLASVEKGRKIIYMHSNLNKEQRLRFPRLKITRGLLDKYDVFVPVSESLREEVAKDFPQFKHKLRVCENLINWRKVISWSQERPDILVESECYNFITIGRYSPEKGHERLLQAFKAVSEKHPHARLYIVASHGNLENATKGWIKGLGLQSKVILTGSLDNPYSLLCQCDCFVLSSLYEGQGIVLLEAMALNIPVISTDVEGARSVVGDYGLLVDSSVAGLEVGLETALDKGLPKPYFDSKEYDRRVMDKFNRILEG